MRVSPPRTQRKEIAVAIEELVGLPAAVDVGHRGATSTWSDVGDDDGS